MSQNRKQRATEREVRLHEAEAATEALADHGQAVIRQLSLVDRLIEGWRKVHERNHLAKIFHEQGGL